LVSFRCRPAPSADNTQFEVRRVPRESEKAYDCVSCGRKPPPGGGCLRAPAHLLKCPPIQYPSTHLAHVGRVEAQASPRIREPMICVRFIQKRGIERTPTALEQYCWGLGRTKGKLKVSQVRAKVQHAEVRGKSACDLFKRNSSRGFRVGRGHGRFSHCEVHTHRRPETV
jgi:hypothetical protein